MFYRLLLCLFFIASLQSCSQNHQPSTKNIQPSTKNEIIIWSSNIAFGAPLWEKEISKRFNSSILLICHGGTHVTFKDNKIIREWWVYPDKPRKPMSVQAVADTLANLYPNKPIVLLVCNQEAYEITTQNVYYAKANVWVIPDSFIKKPNKNREIIPFYKETGSIWEFRTKDDIFNWKTALYLILIS